MQRGRAALREGAPILCDAMMVASGITRHRLPADNDVMCTLDDPRVPGLATELGTTRSAAALELWGQRLHGAVVAVGNAPTALFHLLELMGRTDARPAVVLGLPVGFIGAAESKLRPGRQPVRRAVPGGARAPGWQRHGGGRGQRRRLGARMSGVLHGVGVGPGDPELVTVRAARLISGAAVVAYHAGPAGQLTRPRLRHAVPAGGPDRGGTGLPGHPRRHRAPGWLRRRDRGVLRRRRRPVGRAPGRRP